MFFEERQPTINQLEQLTSRVNAEQLFTVCFFYLALRPLDGQSILAFSERPLALELLAYWLYPKFSTTSQQGMPSCEEIEQCLNLIHTLAKTEGLSNIDLAPAAEGQPPIDDVDELSAYMKLQSTYLRGSAYAEQTAEEIRATQGRFEAWFKKQTGIGPSRAVDLVFAIVDAGQKAFGVVQAARSATSADLEESADHEKMRQSLDAIARVAVHHLPVPLSSIDPALGVSHEEWMALGRLIGCTQEVRSTIQHVHEMARLPLYVLSQERFLLSNVSSAFDELQAAYDRVARSHEKFYQRYQRHQADVIVQQVVKSLSGLFPPSAVSLTLDYPDPDKPQDPPSTAEVDVIVDWPPFLFLIEVKAKQVRRQSMLGDMKRLRTDLQESVEEAFSQGFRALRYVQSTQQPRFTQRETKKTIEIDHSRLKRIYLMAVTQHDVSQLSAMLHRLQPMGLFRGGEYPWSLSAANLETITRFCPGPDVFAHYADRRIDAMRRSTILRGDELEYFGFYLESRLIHLDSLLNSVVGLFDYSALLGYQVQFDMAMSHRRGHLALAPEIKLHVPDEVRAILEELRRRDTPDDRWIAFCILSMSSEELDGLAAAFRDARTDEPPASGFLSEATRRTDDLTISIVSTVDAVPDVLKNYVQSSLSLEKYRQRTARGIGFGVVLKSGASYFEHVHFVDEPWKYDPDLEARLRAEEGREPQPKVERPGRNDPCPCGSGRKYKHCCGGRR
jgi:hypothetical protein